MIPLVFKPRYTPSQQAFHDLIALISKNCGLQAALTVVALILEASTVASDPSYSIMEKYGLDSEELVQAMREYAKQQGLQLIPQGEFRFTEANFTLQGLAEMYQLVCILAKNGGFRYKDPHKAGEGSVLERRNEDGLS